MRSSIPTFSSVIRSLSLLLEDVYKTVGKRPFRDAEKLTMTDLY